MAKNKRVPPTEMYRIGISDDLHPVGLRMSRKDDANGVQVTTITFEYLLKGVDSRDVSGKLETLDSLFTRVFTVTDEASPHPQNVMTAIGTISQYMESLAKDVEFPPAA